MSCVASKAKLPDSSDKKLRLLMLDALERIEIAMRVDIALLLGKRDKFAYRNADELHGQFSKKATKQLTNGTMVTEWSTPIIESRV